MYRRILQDLANWKRKENRKPLIIWGARQVGKTWAMQEFGRTCFGNTLYISFYNNQSDASVFEKDYDIKRILKVLEIQHHTKIEPEKTLIIFDEIQNAPRVTESLKYFCEEAPQYAVIAAGSLLGVSIHKGISFPVGKVDEMHLFPMSFSEYLMAMGETELALLVEKKDPSDPLITDLSETFASHLRNYFFVGGMPEVVKIFKESGDYHQVRALQNAILSQYEGDFGKHIEARELPRIRMVWHSLPMQLAKENRKFFFGQIKQGARMKDFEIAIEWLCDAGIVHKVHKVTKPAMPLKSYISFSDFKLYMNDTGLLCALSDLDEESVVKGNDIFVEFKGALTEQYVLQELIATTPYTPYYYSGDKSTYEMDFLIQKGKDVIPVEVKAVQNLKAKSLKAYIDKFSPKTAIRTSMAPYKEQGPLLNIPLWVISGI